MKERPILFSAPNVRAILEGRKTQTRRLVPPVWTVEDIKPPWWWTKARLVHRPTCIRELCEQVDDSELACYGFEFTNKHAPRSPFGSPGDRLWVRETHAFASRNHWPDLPHVFSPVETGLGVTVYYRAGFDRAKSGLTWRPSIHMPRWASRITLEVTEVRVERLQDISEADAEAEGVERVFGRDVPPAMGGGVETWRDYLEEGWRTSARSSFVTLWESIHGRGAWAKNPWVWAINFKRVTKEQHT